VTRRRDRPGHPGHPRQADPGSSDPAPTDPGTGHPGPDTGPGTGRPSLGHSDPGRAWVLAWGLWGLVLVGLVVALGIDQALRRMGRPDLVSVGGDALPYLLAMASAATVGAVLAGRRPRHPVGWLLLAVGVSVIALGVADAYASYGLLARPGSLPGARWAAIYVDSSWVVVSVLLGFVLLLTPTGALPSPRWRWWARLVVVAAVVALTFRTAPLDPPYGAVEPGPVLVRDGPLATVGRAGVVGAFVVVLLSLLVAAGSLVVRFRRARCVERQQLRWVSVAAAMAALAVALTLVSWAMLGSAATPLWGWAEGVYVTLLPLAIGAAILRYRLYDLDRIISRTVAWTLLTLLLGLGYALVVLGLGRLLPEGSSLGVAAATLAVAAVFQPARRRIQAAVDRRFNRRRYDAARTIAAFGARLREQVDLDTLSAELLSVTHQTMQPTTASLWLRARP
jgi:hypothetical protein